MNLKYVAIAVLLVGGLGYAFGRYLQPPEIKQVTKEVEVIKKDVHTVIKEIERPDGTKERVTIIEDKSSESSKKTSQTEISNVKPQWKAQGLVGISARDPMFYGADVERRILGPVFVGLWANTNKEIGASFSIEF